MRSGKWSSKVQEQRRAPRKRTLYDARVVFNNRFSIIECTVRDISDTGARISFPHSTPLPPEVELEIFRTGQSFRARVMWSSGNQHGLMFIDETGQNTVPAQEPLLPSHATIQAIVDEARARIAHAAGVSPDAVTLKLEIKH